MLQAIYIFHSSGDDSWFLLHQEKSLLSYFPFWSILTKYDSVPHNLF